MTATGLEVVSLGGVTVGDTDGVGGTVVEVTVVDTGEEMQNREWFYTRYVICACTHDPSPKGKIPL